MYHIWVLQRLLYELFEVQVYLESRLFQWTLFLRKENKQVYKVVLRLAGFVKCY